MKVQLIDYTGIGHSDVWYAARKLIRAKNTRMPSSFVERVSEMNGYDIVKELEAIAMTIRSSWEFVSYTFTVNDISRATCDQMTRTRVGVAFAVMTQRVTDLKDFKYVVPGAISERKELEVLYHDHMTRTSAFYALLIENGISTQDARSILPMATHSPLTAEYNLRSLADLVGKRQNLRAQGEYSDVVAEMAHQVICVHPWTEMFLYPERTKTPTLDKMLKEALGDRTVNERPEVGKALKEVDLLKGTWG